MGVLAGKVLSGVCAVCLQFDLTPAVRSGASAGVSEAGGRTRTDGLIITSDLLYQLSYSGAAPWYAISVLSVLDTAQPRRLATWADGAP
jgi:hypothetical protein